MESLMFFHNAVFPFKSTMQYKQTSEVLSSDPIFFAPKLVKSFCSQVLADFANEVLHYILFHPLKDFC